jgi:TRAP-type C4-dicarboxylate transport system permease small subunit
VILLARAAALVRSAATILATLAFAAVVLAFGYGVLARYGLHDPSDRAGEAAIILYIWTIMIGGSLAVGLRDQISFDLLVDRMRPPANRIVEGIGMAVAGGILLYALPTTIDYILFLWREKTPAFELSLDKVYFCFIVFHAASAAMLIARAAQCLFGIGADRNPGPDAERGLS